MASSFGQWKRALSRRTGSSFWVNTATGESTWELGAFQPGLDNSPAEIDGASPTSWEVAQNEFILYLESLSRVDESLAGVLQVLPTALRRSLESDVFRMRANARFKELSFLSDSSNGAATLSVQEFVPQAAELLEDRPWLKLLGPLEASRGLFRVFAPKSNAAATGAAENQPPPMSLRRVGFQRMLSAVAIVAYLERRDPLGLSEGASGQSTRVAAAVAAMATHATHDPPPLTRAEEVEANQLAEQVIAERLKKLHSTTLHHDPLPEEPLNRVRSANDDDDNAPLVFSFDSPSPDGAPRQNSTPFAPVESVGFVDTICWVAMPALRPESRALALAAAAAETVNFASSTQLLLGSNLTDLEPPEAVLRVRRASTGLLGAVKVRYGTVPGTAEAGVQFLPCFGVLELGVGEVEGEVRVPLLSRRWQGGRGLGETRQADPLTFLNPDSPLNEMQSGALAVAEATALTFTAVLKAPSLHLSNQGNDAANDGGRVDLSSDSSTATVRILLTPPPPLPPQPPPITRGRVDSPRLEKLLTEAGLEKHRQPLFEAGVRSLDDALELDEPSMHTLLRCLSANNEPSPFGGDDRYGHGASFFTEQDGETLLAAVDSKKQALRKSAVRWGLPPYVTGTKSTSRRLKPSLVVDGVQVRAPGHVIGEEEGEELVLHDPLTEEEEEEAVEDVQEYEDELAYNDEEEVDDQQFMERSMSRESYSSVGGGPSVSEDDRNAAPSRYTRNDDDNELYNYEEPQDTSDRRVPSQSLPRRLHQAASYAFPRESFEYSRPNGPPLVPPPPLPASSPWLQSGQPRRQDPAYSTAANGHDRSGARARGGAVGWSRNGSGMTRSRSAVDNGRSHHSSNNHSSSRHRNPPKAGNALQKWAQVKAEAEAEAHLDAAHASIGSSSSHKQPTAGMSDRLKHIEAQFRQPIKPWAQRPIVASPSPSQPPRVRTPPRRQAGAPPPAATLTSTDATAARPRPRRRLTPGSTLMAAAGALSGASGNTPPKSVRQVAWMEKESAEESYAVPVEAGSEYAQDESVLNQGAAASSSSGAARAAPPVVPRSRVFAAVRPPSVVPPEQAALLNAAQGGAGPGVATVVSRPHLSLSAALVRSWGRLGPTTGDAANGEHRGRSRSNSLSRLRESYDNLMGNAFKSNANNTNGNHSKGGSKINGGLWTAASAGARAQFGNVANTGSSSSAAGEAPSGDGPSSQRMRVPRPPPSSKPSLLRAAAAGGQLFNGRYPSSNMQATAAPPNRRSPDPSHLAALRSNSLSSDPDGMKMMLADMEASAIVAAQKAETLFDVVNAMGPLPPREPSPVVNNSNGSRNSNVGGKSSILQAAARAGVMRSAAGASAESSTDPTPRDSSPIEDDPDGLKMLIASMEAAIKQATVNASSLATAVEAMGPLPREKTPTPPPQRPLMLGRGSSLAAAAGLGSAWPWNKTNSRGYDGGGFGEENDGRGGDMPHNNAGNDDDIVAGFTSQRAANSQVVQTLKDASRNLAQRLLQLGDDIVESGGGDVASFVHEASALAAMRLQAQVAALEGEVVGRGGADAQEEEYEEMANPSGGWDPNYGGPQGEEEQLEEGSYRGFYGDEDEEEEVGYENEWGRDAGSMNLRAGTQEQEEDEGIEVIAAWPADPSLPPPPPLPPPPEAVYFEALALLRPREGRHRDAPLSLDVAPFQKGDIFEAWGDGEEVEGWLRVAGSNNDEEIPTWVPARNSARDLVRHVPPPFASNTNNPQASTSSVWDDDAGQAALDAANAEAEEMRLAVAEAAAALENGVHDEELLIEEVEGGVSRSNGGNAEGEVGEESALVDNHPPDGSSSNAPAEYEEDWDAGSFDRELAMQEELQAREAEAQARAEEARRIAESELAIAREAVAPLEAFLDSVYRPLVGGPTSRLGKLSPKQFFKQCGRDRALAKNNAYHASGLSAADFKTILKWGGVDYLHKDCTDLRAAIKAVDRGDFLRLAADVEAAHAAKVAATAPEKKAKKSSSSAAAAKTPPKARPGSSGGGRGGGGGGGAKGAVAKPVKPPKTGNSISFDLWIAAHRAAQFLPLPTVDEYVQQKEEQRVEPQMQEFLEQAARKAAAAAASASAAAPTSDPSGSSKKDVAEDPTPPKNGRKPNFEAQGLEPSASPAEDEVSTAAATAAAVPSTNTSPGNTESAAPTSTGGENAPNTAASAAAETDTGPSLTDAGDDAQNPPVVDAPEAMPLSAEELESQEVDRAYQKVKAKQEKDSAAAAAAAAADTTATAITSEGAGGNSATTTPGEGEGSEEKPPEEPVKDKSGVTKVKIKKAKPPPPPDRSLENAMETWTLQKTRRDDLYSQALQALKKPPARARSSILEAGSGSGGTATTRSSYVSPRGAPKARSKSIHIASHPADAISPSSPSSHAVSASLPRPNTADDETY